MTKLFLSIILIVNFIALKPGQAASIPANVDLDCGGLNEPTCSYDGPYGNFFAAPDNLGCDSGLTEVLTLEGFFCRNASRFSGEPQQRFDSDLKSWKWAFNQQQILSRSEPVNWTSRLMTHNSSNSNLGDDVLLISANQKYSITDQLEFGARRLELDLHWFANSMRVCHGTPAPKHTGCTTASRPYYLAIEEIRDWLDRNQGEFIIIDIEDQSETMTDEVIWPIEHILADKVLRTDIQVLNPKTDTMEDIKKYIRDELKRLPTLDEIRNLNFPPYQVMFVHEGASNHEPWQWSNTAIGGFSTRTINFSFTDNYETCSINSNQIIPFNGSGATDITGKFRRVYEARSLLDGFAPAGYLNKELTPLNRELQARIKDVVSCNFTPAIDFLFSQENTANGSCLQGADCRDPDLRHEDLIWSWKKDDAGTTGNKGVFDPMDSHWTARNENEQHHFACAKARNNKIDPSNWPDKDGMDWKITDAVGTWDQGEETCIKEFTDMDPTVPIVGITDVFFPFSVPRNGWMNQRLRLAWEEATQRTTFTDPDAKVWLNYERSSTGNFFPVQTPLALIRTFETNPALNAVYEGDEVDFTFYQIINPFNLPLTKVLWTLEGLGFSDLTFDATDLTGISPMPASASFVFDGNEVPEISGLDDFALAVSLRSDLSETPQNFSEGTIDEKIVTFSVLNRPPQIENAPGNLGQDNLFKTTQGWAIPTNLSYRFMDPGGQKDGPFTCSVDYGDGSPVIVTASNTPNEQGHSCRYGEEFFPNILTHTYTSEGTYTVKISVTDKDGDTDEYSFKVVNEEPKAPPQIGGGCAGQTIELDGSGQAIFSCSPIFTDINETDTHTAEIDFGDGSAVETLTITPISSTGYVVILSHQYNTAGTYNAKLKVTDNTGLSDTATYEVKVQEPVQLVPPTIQVVNPDGSVINGPFFPALNGTEGQSVTRTFRIIDTNSQFSEWRLFIAWGDRLLDTGEIGLNEVFSNLTRDNQGNIDITVSHLYPCNQFGCLDKSTGDFGVYVFAAAMPPPNTNLTPPRSVAHTFTTSIKPTNIPPVLDGVITNDAEIDEGMLFERKAQSFTDADMNDPWKVTVDYGDGTVEMPVLNGKSFDLSHVYPDNGLYKVTILVNDGEASDSKRFNVKVNNIAPNVTVSPDVQANVNETVNVNGNWQDPGAEFDQLYQWVWKVNGVQQAQGDALYNSEIPFSTQLAAPGIYTLSLEITDKDGATGMASLKVEVKSSPIADAGPDQVLECKSPTGTQATLDGSGSSDPDGDVLEFLWSSDVFGQLKGEIVQTDFPLGDSAVNLTVTDKDKNSDSDEVMIMIEDTLAPMITAPADIQVECASPQGTQVDLGEPTVTDICDVDPAFFSDAPAYFPFGTTNVEWTATDATGNLSFASQQVTVIDSTAPEVNASASPSVLWPPNHKMVDVLIQTAVTDACDANATCRIIGVSSNEPINGLGDGNTDVDWIINGDLSLQLRAERSGKAVGRTYFIEIACEDMSGQIVNDIVTVKVPHDKSKKQ